MSVRTPRACEICEAVYRPTYGAQRTCGRVCGVVLHRQNAQATGRWPVPASRVYIRNCDWCSKLFVSRRSNAKRCGADCARRASSRDISVYLTARYHADPDFRDQMLSAAHARRADKLGLGSKTILLGYLIKRDHGRCGICHKPVRAKTGPMRPSVDHIVPLSAGGTHDAANVQLAHYRCNLSKNNRGGGEQLLLVG